MILKNVKTTYNFFLLGIIIFCFPQPRTVLAATEPIINVLILKDKKIASHVHAMVVPGSGLVKEQAEQEGLDKIFVNSGFEWREPGVLCV